MSNRPTNNQLIAIGVELVLFTVLSYFGIKWISTILDPTSKQKEAAKKQVYIYALCIYALYSKLG